MRKNKIYKIKKNVKKYKMNNNNITKVQANLKNLLI